jgi:hypothetical protein
MTDWKNSLIATAVGGLSGTAIGLVAFFLLTSRYYPNMVGTLFLAAPVAAGFSIALVSRKGHSWVAAVLLSVICSLILLVALGKEGTLCAILAFPIVVAGMLIGIGIGVLAGKLVNRARNQNITMGVLLLFAPASIFASAQIERPLFQQPRIEVVQTSVKVNDSPDRVWHRILSVDNVQASKPLLMYIGLPIPERCTMQGEGVGAKRTCYFNAGYIEETVTAWNPPYRLGLSIDRTHMPGRHWLSFERAEYQLQADGAATLLMRTTTVSSRLHPSWYWRPFERFGVESEHNYILRDIALKAAR